MLNINKEELSVRYKDGDMDYFFTEASKIINYVISKDFNIQKDVEPDVAQECLLNLWKKVLDNKIMPERNLMSFIWTNTKFRVKEILRKESNRNRIAQIVYLEDIKGFDIQL